MTTEKTYGQAIRDTVASLREENAKRYTDKQDQISNEQSDEIVAHAVIAAFLERNGEPVARVNNDGFIVEVGDLSLSPGTKLFLAPQPLPSVEDVQSAEDVQDAVSKALRHAWQLGQTYWQQADSESIRQQNKSDLTQEKFNQLIEETRALLKEKR